MFLNAVKIGLLLLFVLFFLGKERYRNMISVEEVPAMSRETNYHEPMPLTRCNGLAAIDSQGYNLSFYLAGRSLLISYDDGRNWIYNVVDQHTTTKGYKYHFERSGYAIFTTDKICIYYEDESENFDCFTIN